MVSTCQHWFLVGNETRSIETALLGWAGIVGLVVGYDAWALATGNQTLSAAFWSTKSHPVWGTLLGVAWGGLTWHLMFGDRQVAPDRLHEVYVAVHPFYIGRNWLVKRRK